MSSYERPPSASPASLSLFPDPNAAPPHSLPAQSNEIALFECAAFDVLPHHQLHHQLHHQSHHHAVPALPPLPPTQHYMSHHVHTQHHHATATQLHHQWRPSNNQLLPPVASLSASASHCMRRVAPQPDCSAVAQPPNCSSSSAMTHVTEFSQNCSVASSSSSSTSVCCCAACSAAPYYSSCCYYDVTGIEQSVPPHNHWSFPGNCSSNSLSSSTCSSKSPPELFFQTTPPLPPPSLPHPPPPPSVSAPVAQHYVTSYSNSTQSFISSSPPSAFPAIGYFDAAQTTAFIPDTSLPLLPPPHRSPLLHAECGPSHFREQLPLPIASSGSFFDDVTANSSQSEISQNQHLVHQQFDKAKQKCTHDDATEKFVVPEIKKEGEPDYEDDATPTRSASRCSDWNAMSHTQPNTVAVASSSSTLLSTTRAVAFTSPTVSTSSQTVDPKLFFWKYNSQCKGPKSSMRLELNTSPPSPAAPLHSRSNTASTSSSSCSQSPPPRVQPHRLLPHPFDDATPVAVASSSSSTRPPVTALTIASSAADEGEERAPQELFGIGTRLQLMNRQMLALSSHISRHLALVSPAPPTSSSSSSSSSTSATSTCVTSPAFPTATITTCMTSFTNLQQQCDATSTLSNAESIANARHEKTKLASKICRLKKKAFHESNRIKAAALRSEADQLKWLIERFRRQIMSNPLRCVTPLSSTSLNDKTTSTVEDAGFTNFARHLIDQSNYVAVAGRCDEHVWQVMQHTNTH